MQNHPRTVPDAAPFTTVELLSQDEIAMLYDNVLNVIVSATPCGHLNFMNSMGMRFLNLNSTSLSD